LLGAAALAGLGLLGRGKDIPVLGLAGAVGAGAGACLFVLGPLARSLARRAAAAERFTLAQRLLAVAEVLAPGAGVRDDVALVVAMREARDGHVQPTIDALAAARQRAPVDARRAIDERIAMLYLAVYRWDDAIAHAEAHLFDMAGAPEGTGLRAALGVAPPVFVELLGAYGYRGDLERAAAMLVRLEDVCAGRDDAGMWLHRGRLMFCALAGRVDAVNAMVEPKRSRHMTRSARTYWQGVAHERRGERDAARAAYTRARSGARGRPRILIDEALARVDHADAVAVPEVARDVIARVEAAPVPAVETRTRTRKPIASRVIAGAMVLVAIAITVLLGDTSDVGVLVRGGALVRGLVADGEWWRVVTCIFVHIGGAHLAVNAMGMIVIGRLAEDLFGSWRTACVFALAGLAGALASYLASSGGISAGASGGLFGVLGAVFVELTLQRRRYRGAWIRGMWGSLAVVAVAQLAVGFLYPVIDQTAHAAGLAVGALAGALLSPHTRFARHGLRAARVVVFAFAATAAWSAAMVVRTPVMTSLTRTLPTTHRVDDLTVTAPASWRVDGDQLADRDQLIVTTWKHGAGDPVQVATWLATQVKHEQDQEQDAHVRLLAPLEHVVRLPGWQVEELAVDLEDGAGGTQAMRVIYAGLALADSAVVVQLELPDTIARAASALLVQVLGSVAVAR
jgi:membrane associated rhomboid family serine protease